MYMVLIRAVGYALAEHMLDGVHMSWVVILYFQQWTDSRIHRVGCRSGLLCTLDRLSIPDLMAVVDECML